MEILQTVEYESWFRRLRDVRAKAKINARLRRIGLHGELIGDCKPVGGKVTELRFDTGPGYRVYVTEENGSCSCCLSAATSRPSSRISRRHSGLRRNGGRAMTTEVSKWDVSEYLESEEDIAEYLNAVIEEDDPALLQEALGDIARARGMSGIAREAGVGRESLYKSLSSTGNPSFATIAKVLTALGLKITIAPANKLGEAAS